MFYFINTLTSYTINEIWKLILLEKTKMYLIINYFETLELFWFYICCSLYNLIV